MGIFRMKNINCCCTSTGIISWDLIQFTAIFLKL